MKKRATIRELSVERLVIREPNEGRVRAVLETHGEGAVPAVRLSLLNARGEPALVAQIDADGDPSIHVGHPDHGPTITITPRALDIWFIGNVVASVRSSEDGGCVEVTDGEGKNLRTFPERR